MVSRSVFVTPCTDTVHKLSVEHSDEH